MDSELEKNLRLNRRDRRLIGLFLWILAGILLLSSWFTQDPKWQWLLVGLLAFVLIIGMRSRHKINLYLKKWDDRGE